MKYCDQCGNALDLDSKYCHQCGARLQDSPPVPFPPDSTPVSIAQRSRRHSRGLIVVAGILTLIPLIYFGGTYAYVNLYFTTVDGAIATEYSIGDYGRISYVTYQVGARKYVVAAERVQYRNGKVLKIFSKSPFTYDKKLECTINSPYNIQVYINNPPNMQYILYTDPFTSRSITMNGLPNMVKNQPLDVTPGQTVKVRGRDYVMLP